MNLKRKILFITTIVLIFGITSIVPGISQKSQSTQQPLIPYVNFDTSSVVYNGKTDESGFETVTINLLTTNTNTITVNWRQNGKDLHVVISADVTGYVAIGWNNVALSGSGGTLMEGTNIILGTYATDKPKSRDDVGFNSGHRIDGINNIIDFNVTEANGGTNFEFTFPLDSSDKVDDVSLSVKGYGYFIFAISDSDDLDGQHLEASDGAYYMPNVYIQSDAGEVYQAPASTPFGEPILIVFALVIGAIYIKKRKN